MAPLNAGTVSDSSLSQAETRAARCLARAGNVAGVAVSEEEEEGDTDSKSGVLGAVTPAERYRCETVHGSVRKPPLGMSTLSGRAS